MAKVWEEKDNIFLKENYLNYSNQDLADMFGVTKKSIQGKLRRLGLHRKEDGCELSASAADDTAILRKEEKQEDKPLFRRKRLSGRIPKGIVEMPPSAAYRPVELTEKRKRAIREFDNAISILSTGDRERAKQEFHFIREHFPKELDIVQRAESWICMLDKKPPFEPETADDFYILGVESAQKCMWDKALDCFMKAVEKDPDFTDAEYNIACIMSKRGEFDKALDILWNLSETHDRYIENAIEDEDFEPLWQNESFINLARGYAEDHT